MNVFPRASMGFDCNEQGNVLWWDGLAKLFQNFIEEHCYQACFISVGDLLRGRSTCCGPIQGSSNVAIVLHILPNAAVSQSCVTIVP